MGVSAAPRREVCTIEAGNPHQTSVSERLRIPELQGLMAEPSLDGVESLSADAVLLAEVCLCGNRILIIAYTRQIGVPPQTLHQILHIRDLQKLPQHQNPQFPLRTILNRPPDPF